jgi:hypothetical protein
LISAGAALTCAIVKKSAALAGLIYLSVLPLPAERINQEGRILGALPVVTNSILFNTSNADAVVSAMQIVPVTNPWNECISNRPVLVNSDAMIANINTNLVAANRSLIAEFEMNFVLVPTNQPLVPMAFVTYPDDSDLNGGTYPSGLYPIPTNLPIETWPVGTGGQTLLQWQTNNTGGDRHSIIVQPGNGQDWETWMALRSGTNWQAANGAIFSLNTNSLRPDGLTSGDAAGLPMFPALVRYDEAERGMVEHACRIVVKKSRKQHIYPATHDASFTPATQTNVPAMGQRVRLKTAYVIPANWTTEEKAVLLGLKKYGALVADNGNYFSISVTPDDRWPAGCFNHLTSIGVTNFEVVLTTDTNEGPRSAGAPSANAGPDQTVVFGQPATLAGVVNFSNAVPVIFWKSYSGPGTVTFGNTAQTNTTATFSAPGIYTLELGADDGVHAVAYDAVVINVMDVINVSIARAGTNVNVSWSGGVAPYVVQRAGALPATWSDLVTTSAHSTNFPGTNTAGFFRVKGQ